MSDGRRAGFVLGIETSARTGGAALLHDGAPIAEATLPPGLVHGRSIVAALHGLFADAGVAPSALARVAVNAGPGSHTGLRVGLIAAKAIAWSLGCPVAGVDANHALAAQATPSPDADRPVATAIDARASGVFCGLFDGDDWAIAPALRAPDRFAASLAPGTRVIGTGAARVVDTADALTADALTAGDETEATIRAATIAALGARLDATTPAALRATYFR